MPYRFGRASKGDCQFAHQVSKNITGVGKPETVFDFKVELLEATIPTSADAELPAKPIIFHQRWEPAQRVNANLERESKENLVSYQWLEEHISKNSQSILNDGKKILLVWRFLWGNRKFQTSHQIVHIDGIYTLIFNHNRPTYSPHVSSLFEELLAPHIQNHTRKQVTLVGKWKYQVLLRLKYYFQYLCVWTWQQPDMQDPEKNRASMDYKDAITLLGDLLPESEDEDWVYVTILDLESNDGEAIASETPVQNRNFSGRLNEEVKVQDGACASIQTPQLPGHNTLSWRPRSVDAQEQAKVAPYQCQVKGNGFTCNHLRPLESNVSANGKDPVTATCSTRVEPSTERLSPRKPHQCILEHHSQDSEELDTMHYLLGDIEVLDTSIFPRESERARLGFNDLARSLCSQRRHSYPIKDIKRRSQSTSSLREKYLQYPLSILNDNADNSNPPLNERRTERTMQDFSAFHQNSASNIYPEIPLHSHIPCDSSHTNKSESQSRFSWGETQPSRTTPTSLGGAIETSSHINNQQDPLRNKRFNYSSWEKLSNDFDDEDYPFRLIPVSTSSSESTEMPFPDEYWSWSAEDNNYFHTESKSDGTEETTWYPRKFA
ncbi:hypothetical protein F4805DRAFT_456309 [Annulohypoxylon moriforme]|nr:hypothetical protein F4805DRAFT_456309 [Annulohypoxylon moriforme]